MKITLTKNGQGKLRVRALLAVFSLSLVFVFFALSCCQSDSLLSKPPRYVFLITLDTLRADYVSVYSQAKAKTPTLEEFARQGVSLDLAYSPIPITAPAHATIFYSLPPHQLKLYNNGQIFKPGEKDNSPLISLSQIFQRRKYSTAAFVSLGVLKAKFGLRIGFDFYEDRFPPDRWYLTAEEVNQKFFTWLDNFSGNKAFIWLHYSDPHDPYAPPHTMDDVELTINQKEKKRFCLRKMEPFQLNFKANQGKNVVYIKVLQPHPEGKVRLRLSQIEVKDQDGRKIPFIIHCFDNYEQIDQKFWLIKHEATISFFATGDVSEVNLQAHSDMFWTIEEQRQAYRQEVEYLDAQLKALQEELMARGIWEKSLFILAGDHGEGLGERRTRFGDFHFGHIHFLYDHYLRVPFIISSPLLKQKIRANSQVVSLEDVAPTLLALLGWKRPSFYHGKNIFKTEKSKNYSFVFLETYRPEAVEERFGGLFYPWHLIFTPVRQKVELYHLQEDPEERNNLELAKINAPEVKFLVQKVTETALKILDEKEETILDPKALEILKSLGYIK